MTPVGATAAAADANLRPASSLTRDMDWELIRDVSPRSLSDAYIECDRCEALMQGKQVSELNIYVLQERSEDIGKVARAFRSATVGNPPGDKATFTMLVDAIQPAGPVCSDKMYCKSRPFCVSMGGCSENLSPLPCKICDGILGVRANGECADEKPLKAK